MLIQAIGCLLIKSIYINKIIFISQSIYICFDVTLSEYNKARYAQIIDLNVIDKNMCCENFEKKWGFNDNQNGKEVLPNFVLCKNNEYEIEKTKEVMDGFADSQYSGGDELEYFTLRFTQKDIDEIRNKLIDEIRINIALNTFETIVSYLCFFIAKYECKNGLLNGIFIPFNLRDRVSIFNSNNIGGCVTGIAIDINNMQYNASSFALSLHDCLNIYSRKSKQIDIYGENNDYCKQVQELQTETCLMFVKYSYKYNTWETITEAIESANIMMNEYRTSKLYLNYSFGINETKPLYYMNGTHYTVHRFMLLPSPDDDGVVVSIRMAKSKTDKFRKNEKEFFDKHEEKQPLNLHEKIYNYE